MTGFEGFDRQAQAMIAAFQEMMESGELDSAPRTEPAPTWTDYSSLLHSMTSSDRSSARLYSPLLFIADRADNPARELMAMARSIQTSQPRSTFSVITTNQSTWDGSVAHTAHHQGVFSPYNTGASDNILSVAGWAHSHRNTKGGQHWLLIDDLELTLNHLEFDGVANLRWLLNNGVRHDTHVVVSANASWAKTDYNSFHTMIPFFADYHQNHLYPGQHRFVGPIQDQSILNQLSQVTAA